MQKMQAQKMKKKKSQRMSGSRRTREPAGLDHDSDKHSGPTTGKPTLRETTGKARRDLAASFSTDVTDVVAEKLVKDEAFKSDVLKCIEKWMKDASLDDAKALVAVLPDDVVAELERAACDRFYEARQCFRGMIDSAKEGLRQARHDLLFSSFFDNRPECRGDRHCIPHRKDLLESMTIAELKDVAKELQVKERVKAEKGKAKMIQELGERLGDSKGTPMWTHDFIPSPLPTFAYLDKLFSDQDARKRELDRLRRLKHKNAMSVYCFLAVACSRLHDWDVAECARTGRTTAKQKIDKVWCKLLRCSQTTLDRLLGMVFSSQL